MRRTALLLGLVTLAAGACGFSPAKSLEPSSVADEISSNLRSHYSVTSSVTCQKTISAKKGSKFVCTSVLDGQTLHLDGVVTSSKGAFTVRPREVIIAVTSIALNLEQSGVVPEVNCEGRQIVIVPHSQSATCSVTFPGETPRQMTIKISPTGSVTLVPS